MGCRWSGGNVITPASSWHVPLVGKAGSLGLSSTANEFLHRAWKAHSMPHLTIPFEAGSHIQTHLPDLSQHLIPHNPDAHNSSLSRQSHQVSPTCQLCRHSSFILSSTLLHSHGPFGPSHASSCLLISHYTLVAQTGMQGNCGYLNRPFKFYPLRPLDVFSDLVQSTASLWSSAWPHSFTMTTVDYSYLPVSPPSHWLQPLSAILPSPCSGSKSHRLLD